MRDDNMPTYESAGCSLEHRPRSWFWYGRTESGMGGYAPPDGLLPGILYRIGFICGRLSRAPGALYRLTIYRTLMRAIHRFGWCHMQAQPIIDYGERPRFWCHWCGMRGSK